MRTDTDQKPFTIDVPQTILDDLRVRLLRTRLPTPTPGPSWAAGTDPSYLGRLVKYWAESYDWRAAERTLNSYPHFMMELSGTAVHFVHVRAARNGHGRQPVPLILTHGWPSTFFEMLPMVALLTDPAAHGGDPADAFDVVIPDLPGYAFSAPLTSGPTTEPVIADLWAQLMSRLGYDRFGAYGGDIGSGVSTWLGARHPDRVLGIHTHHAKFPPQNRRTDLTPAEEGFVAKLRAKADDDWAYGFAQETRPDTLAAGLTDSPAGLAAWIIEKFQRWGDCGGDVERRFSRDDLLTMVMLYWVTGCIGTSFRPYYDDHAAPELPMVDVPVGITMSVEDIGMPREFAARVYSDIRHWREPTRGGHFFAMEEPGYLADELRLFFHGGRG